VDVVDGMATDIPYGRASTTSGQGAIGMMERLLRSAAGVLREGTRLVVMHPKTVPVRSKQNFEVEEEHHLYIHSKLTRTISVLRRL
jgi:tRNA G10  N-methylase Trm11